MTAAKSLFIRLISIWLNPCAIGWLPERFRVPGYFPVRSIDRKDISRARFIDFKRNPIVALRQHIRQIRDKSVRSINFTCGPAARRKTVAPGHLVLLPPNDVPIATPHFDGKGQIPGCGIGTIDCMIERNVKALGVPRPRRLDTHTDKTNQIFPGNCLRILGRTCKSEPRDFAL